MYFPSLNRFWNQSSGIQADSVRNPSGFLQVIGDGLAVRISFLVKSRVLGRRRFQRYAEASAGDERSGCSSGLEKRANIVAR
jgi:hypothetical protein